MRYILGLFICFVAIQVTAQNVLKIDAGAALKTTGGAVITLQDMNLQNDGTINQLPGEGVFRFSGTGNNTISGNNVPLFDIFQIAKTGTAQVSLQQNINIGTGITFTSGLIDLNNNNIFLAPTALLNGENETSRITGTTAGYIQIINTLNAPISANPGNLGVSITSSANLGSTTIRRGHQSQTNGAGAGNSILRYFDITPTNNTGLNATLNFKYLDAELNGITEPSISLWKSINNTNWTNEGFDRRSAVTNYVEKSNITGFSRWTLSSVGNALPVQFSLFNVKCDGNNVLIIWKTATEINSSHFEVQLSENGINWTAIGTVPAAGTSSTERSYAYTDNNPLPTAFYRIAEFDLDGRTQYTSIIKNDCGQQNSIQLWPNPVKSILYANITVASASAATISVYDAKGSMVKQQQNNLLSGNNQVSIDMSRFTNGIYHVVASWDNGNQKQSFKIIKQ